MNVFKIIKEIEKIDPEVYDRLDSRRSVFKSFSNMGAKIAVAAVPVMLGSMFSKAYGKGNDAISDVLNYALTLEYLESDFYTQALASTVIPTDRRTIFQQIKKHEDAHVAFLKTTLQALQAPAVAKPTFDFTAKGTYPTVFTNYTTFLTLAQAFEDTGVRAYKGQAAVLIPNNDVLTAALQIHSVEARHAAMVRRLKNLDGWINGTDGGGAPAAVYAGEDNLAQGAVTDVSKLGSGYTAAVGSAAFDEPLTKEQVLAIANPFIAV